MKLPQQISTNYLKLSLHSLNQKQYRLVCISNMYTVVPYHRVHLMWTTLTTCSEINLIFLNLRTRFDQGPGFRLFSAHIDTRRKTGWSKILYSNHLPLTDIKISTKWNNLSDFLNLISGYFDVSDTAGEQILPFIYMSLTSYMSEQVC